MKIGNWSQFSKVCKNRRFFKCYTFVSDFKLRKPYYLHYCLQVFVTSVKKWSWQAATATLFAFYFLQMLDIWDYFKGYCFSPKRAKLSSSPLSNPQGNKLFSVSERVAVKIIDKGKLDGKTQKMVTREINIMDSLSHPNLIRYLS